MVYSESIIQAVGLLRERPWLNDTYVDFYQELTRLQEEASDALTASLSKDGVSSDAARVNLKEGVHIIDIGNVRMDGPLHRDLMLSILDLIAVQGESGAVDARQVMEAVNTGKLNAVELVQQVLMKDETVVSDLAETLDVEAGFLRFLAYQTGKPYMKCLAVHVRAMLGEEIWQGGMCPVCGQEPSMARLEYEEGRRYLHCSMCGTEWPYQRLHCPFCLNDDQNTLRFFFVDENSPYRVDVCDACKRYIKTIDERKLEERAVFHLDVEHIGTLQLDILAFREGFTGSLFSLLPGDREASPSS